LKSLFANVIRPTAITLFGKEVPSQIQEVGEIFMPMQNNEEHTSWNMSHSHTLRRMTVNQREKTISLTPQT